MKLKDALSTMRELTKRNVPFSIGFFSCNTTNLSSDGYKEVESVLLRKGYSQKHSDKHNTLIAYTNTITNEDRQFYIPLLMKFNGNIIEP